MGWKARLLSITGKEDSIKAITCAILMFLMSCFKIHVGGKPRMQFFMGMVESACWQGFISKRS
ncbi:conserved hypothetical protein [Ricinus communis]|uniref:Uncharacterized protein n=1 Tax=Ricinus communis TaxID=3988 RepID=B9RRM9_RICCO|nr:conserved hypothetical protein [Ricinus communis]